jgi:anaerobic magnesium-protoporphyrin IX monomethyl ester cyclase
MKILFVMVKEDYIDPMNIEILSALARRQGYDCFLNVLEHNNLFQEIETIKPDIIAYSAKTGESNIMFKANRAIKEKLGSSIFTVMGGPHCTFNHSRMQLWQEKLIPKPPNQDKAPTAPIEITDLDCLFVGEADDVWPQFLKIFSSGQSFDHLSNIVTKSNRRQDGSVFLLPRTSAMDALPFLDRDFVYAKTRLKKFGMRSIMASRGCPFICTYCFNAKFNSLYRNNGKVVNRYSVPRLLDEIEDLVNKHPTQFIKFYDDVFTFRADDWLKEFAVEYPKRIGLPFHCLVRADLVHRDPDILKYLKMAGIQSISMSIESGNAFIRDHIFKRQMDEKDILEAFSLCKKMGIHTFSNTILAVPAPLIPLPDSQTFTQDLEKLLSHLESYFKIDISSIRAVPLANRSQVIAHLQAMGLRHSPIDYDIDSIDLNIKAGVVFGEFPELHPYPGTQVTQYTIDVGAFDGDFEKLHQNYQTTSPFNCFSEAEKRTQVNLSLLALVLLVFPSWRNFSIHFLAKRPWTRLYFFLYFLAKAYLIGTKIYPMKYSFKHISRTIWESFFTELLKHSRDEGERFYQRLRGFKAPPSEVLGGPWQS